MPAPLLVSCIPASGAVEVPTNSVVRLSFNTPLMASTVVDGVIQVVNIETDEILPASIIHSENEVTIQPGRAFEDFTRFEVHVVGVDVASPNGPLKSEDGTPLARSIYYSFLTSQPMHYGDTDAGSGMYVRGVDTSGQTTEVFVPYFDLLSSLPADDDIFVDPAYINASGISLSFSLPVDEATASGAIRVEQRPFVDRRFSWTQPSDILGSNLPPASGMVYSYPSMNSQNFPAFSITASGTQVLLRFTESGAAKWNSQFLVNISASLKSLPASGTPSGQYLQQAESVVFSAGMFPWYAEIEQVREALGGFNSAFTDFVVARYILKNSLRAWRLACMRFDPYNPPYFVNDYVVLRSLFEILTGPPTLDLLAGETSKSLGDLSITYGNPSSDIKAMLPMWKSATDEYEKWLKTLCVSNPGGLEVTSAVRSVSRADYPPWRYRERHMYNTSRGEGLGYPGSDNTRWDRIQKNPRLDERYVQAGERYIPATGTIT